MAWSASGAERDVSTLLSEIESRHMERIEALRENIRYQLELAEQHFHEELRVIVVEYLRYPVAHEDRRAALGPAVATEAALSFIADSACRSVEELLGHGEGMAWLSQAIQGGSISNLVNAYGAVGLDMRLHMEFGHPNTQHKQALLYIRDLLVLKVCLGGGPWTNENLDQTFSEFFGRSEDTLTSQCILAFNTIVRGGRDRPTFDRTVVKSYGENLAEVTKNNLYIAFKACAETSPSYVSKKRRRARSGGA